MRGGRVLNDDEFKVIIDKLKNNDQSLTELDLSVKRFDDDHDEVIALAEALKKNTTLTTLNIVDNHRLGNFGVIALAEALKENKTLKTLNISHNMIYKEASSALAEALKINTTLTTLYLNWIYGINDEIISKMDKYLERNIETRKQFEKKLKKQPQTLKQIVLKQLSLKKVRDAGEKRFIPKSLVDDKESYNSNSIEFGKPMLGLYR